MKCLNPAGQMTWGWGHRCDLAWGLIQRKEPGPSLAHGAGTIHWATPMHWIGLQLGQLHTLNHACSPGCICRAVNWTHTAQGWKAGHLQDWNAGHYWSDMLFTVPREKILNVFVWESNAHTHCLAGLGNCCLWYSAQGAYETEKAVAGQLKIKWNQSQR